MDAILKFLHKRAEDVLVVLTAVMFLAFIVQIASRYLFNAPTDWTHELILICWLWIVFWGAAFFLRDRDQVKFDVLYNLGAERTRRALSIASSIALAIGFAISVPATWDFISFKKIRSTDILGLRFDFVFSVYLMFLAGVILHYAIRAWKLLRGDSLSTLDREDSL